MKKLLIVLISTLLPQVQAACLKYNPKETKISWKAYKTPLKVGVGGQFNDFSIKSTSQGSLKEILMNSTFNIKTSSVFTKNKARDKKILVNFFRGGDIDISGKVTKVTKSRIVTNLTINGKTKKTPLRYKIQEKRLEAIGHIDVSDFLMSKDLAKLNKACFAQHEGKTWTDVEIKIVSKFTDCP